ncbi:ABC-type protease exporter, ATP-binding component PrtD/AprD [Olavius algarvensis Delta 1 endosymbiont]|nr:ABC-type protease exporter, ATP-binding component PrtD/AprD [Olavius algarvensis Delta 1 endosymbiont]
MNEKNTSPLQDATKKCRFVLLAVAVVSLFVNVLMLTVPLYMLQIYGRVLVSRSHETLIYLSIAAAGALVVMAALDFSRSRILVHMSAWLENRLGPKVLPPAISQQLQSQAYGVQALRDVSQVRQFVASPGIFSLFDSPWVPVYLFVIYLLHPVLFIIAVIGAVLLFALAVANELATRRPLKAANEQNVRALRKTAAAARNAEVIEAMGMMPGITRRWLSDNQEALQQQMVASGRAGVILATSKLCRLILQVAMLGVGGYLVIGYELTPGGMIAGSIILSRALQPIEQAIGSWKSLLAARSAYTRLKTFMTQAQERPADMALPAPQGHLSVEKAVFTPPGGEKPVLKGVSFALEAGESLAIIGPSAAGKSTLARLIVGAWRPNHGAVRLDGADVYAWERVDFGRYVGYLPQDVELFDGTIEDNIARLDEPDPTAVVKAAQQAGVHPMILRLPDGYRTRIGEGGTLLSGGQRQRIGLARALYGEPRLIVLDEPNASLDSEGEEDLLRAMATLKSAGATVVLIAHRPSMVAQVDKILYLRDGVIEMFGPRDEVLPQLTRPVSVVQAKTG